LECMLTYIIQLVGRASDSVTRHLRFDNNSLYVAPRLKNNEGLRLNL
jgi:hypothetical protein